LTYILQSLNSADSSHFNPNFHIWLIINNHRQVNSGRIEVAGTRRRTSRWESVVTCLLIVVYQEMRTYKAPTKRQFAEILDWRYCCWNFSRVTISRIGQQGGR